MRGSKFYITALILGIICAAFVIYFREIVPPAKETAVFAFTEEDEESLLFPAPDKTLYQMDLYFDVNERMLYGKSIITTINTSGQDLNDLWFTVYPNAFVKKDKTPAPEEAYYNGFDKGWLKVSKMKVNGKRVVFLDKGVNLEVILFEKINKGADIKIEIEWQAKIPYLAYRYGSRNGVFILSNFYPALNVLTEEGWLKAENVSFGDPFTFHSASYIVNLNIPEAYDVVSNGSKTARTPEDNGRQGYVIKAQNVRDFSMVLMYHYKEFGIKTENGYIRLYIPDSYKEKAVNILREAASILNFFSKAFSPYPYRDFKIVFVPMQGFEGMEYSGLIFLKEDFLKPDLPAERLSFIMAHEIAHQWWYSLVGNDQIREPWLDEGLANYSASKYQEKVKGKKHSEKNIKGVNLARGLKDMYSRQDYYQTAYYGGESFWWGLEGILGEDNVFKILRHYLAQYKYDIASTEDLLYIIKLESEKDLSYYFARWFKKE
ncbi:M1 family metallopeptidase [Thermosyntropha sp.]|uniref:M1 family metallopeptidase n=1 Tax=Thermosyntropha sp. TaxID=2740820 RepID=UPI0025E97574|nr:M1 family metallopeptidase [Thermosyntropha sp.]MBO8157939.1 M1 family metallopeptidase [Thermosyntropha sp.]